MSDDTTCHHNVATGFERGTVDHAVNHNVAAGLDGHALYHFSCHVHGAIKVNIAGGHIHFFNPQHRLDRDTALDAHWLPAHGRLQQVAVFGGYLCAR